ncbi:LapA family protein [bacterium]|nr:LapA family protein [candidate division CSSED10-310 bacterium]
MKVLKFFIGFLIICAFTMFATANMDKVQVNLLFDDQPLLGYKSVDQVNDDGTIQTVRAARRIPVFILIFGSFGLGFLISWSLSTSLMRGYKKAARSIKKQNDRMLDELNELRNLPVNTPSEPNDNQRAGGKPVLPVK